MNSVLWRLCILLNKNPGNMIFDFISKTTSIKGLIFFIEKNTGLEKKLMVSSYFNFHTWYFTDQLIPWLLQMLWSWNFLHTTKTWQMGMICYTTIPATWLLCILQASSHGMSTAHILVCKLHSMSCGQIHNVTNYIFY